MSEPVAKRHPIDLDEFDRRLRAPAAAQRQGGGEDPLAELARLISNSPDPFAPIFAGGRPEPRPMAGQASRGPAPTRSAVASGAAAAPQPSLETRREAQGLRGGFDGDSAGWPLAEDQAAVDAGGYDEDRAWGQDASAGVRDRSRRSRRSMFLMSAALAVVLVGIAGTLAMRSHGSGFSSPPTIFADAGPFKVKPPSQPVKDQIENSTTLLGKGDSDKVRAAHIVNTQEEPVDLALATPSSGAPAVSGSAPVDPAFSAFPTPRRVKTILVRPDGSVISQNDPAGTGANESSGASTNGATATSDFASASSAGAPSTDAAQTADRGSSSANGPSFATVVDRAASAANDQASVKPSAAPKTPIRATAAHKIQSADLSEDASKDPARSASSDQAAGATGSWAIQLAAPATAQEAHTEIVRLERKFAHELGGRHMTSFSATSNGRSVWRVRVAGLARGDAVSLCGKIKGNGGACFVARN